MEDNRKEEILAAARNCFLKYGYEKTTLDDIGGAAGINKVSLYYYYKNKEAMFSEAVFREADEFAAYLKKKTEAIKDCKKRILTWVDEGLKYGRNDSVLNILTVESLKKLTPKLEELKLYAIKKGTEYLSSVLDIYKTKKEIIPCDTLKVAQTIQKVIYAIKDSAYLNLRTMTDSDDGLEEMKKEILFAVSMILDGITKK